VRTQLVDLVQVYGLEQRLARWEVPIERSDTDSGPARDRLQRGRYACLSERLTRGGEDLVAVALGVGALRASGRWGAQLWSWSCSSSGKVSEV
jgi:hypothetical protein